MNTSYKKSNFGIAFFFLNSAQRAALADVYSFCRLVDDIVDEPAENPQQQLDFWKAEINAAPTTELGKNLAAHIQKYQMDKENFLLLIEGMEMDLRCATYKTFEELEKYLYRVASVVGLMVLEICGVRGAQARQYAKNLGYGVQLTNIVRDIYEDAKLGRVYLPLDDLKKFGVEFEDLQKTNTQKTAPLLKYEAVLAQNFYEAAAAQKLPYSRRQLFAARIMGAVYRAILNKIQKTNFKFTNKVRLNKIEKAAALIKAL